MCTYEKVLIDRAVVKATANHTFLSFVGEKVSLTSQVLSIPCHTAHFCSPLTRALLLFCYSPMFS